MKVLLDTNALLWLLADDPKLSVAARRDIERATVIMISEASLWEIAIKVSIGKLTPIPKLYNVIDDLGFRRLHFEDNYLQKLEVLPMVHRDPFDRMLVAQALSEKASLVTRDTFLKKYGVNIIAT